MKKRSKKQLIWWHSRPVIAFGFILALSALVVQSIRNVYAEEYEFQGTAIRLISKGSTAPADGKTQIKYTIEFFGYKCTNPDWNGVYIIYDKPQYCDDADGENFGPATGTVVRTNAFPGWSGNTYVTAPINSNGFASNLTGGISVGHPHHQVINPGADGRITLSLVSTVPGTQHIHADNGFIVDAETIEFDVNFTAIPGAKPQPAADPNAPPPSSAQGSTIKFIPPATLEIAAEPKKLFNTDTVAINQKAISKSGTKQIFKKEEGVVISGVAIPNAHVTLYIFSDPKTAEVIADGDGKWSYTIKDLPPGDHHVESDVVDPATMTRTGRINLASFKIVSSTDSSASSSKSGEAVVAVNKLPMVYWVGATFALATVLSIFVAKHKRLSVLFHRGPRKTKRRK